jgi:hypothetical protein
VKVRCDQRDDAGSRTPIDGISALTTWAVSSLFIGDYDGTHQSDFDDFDSNSTLRGENSVHLSYRHPSTAQERRL